MKVKLYIGKATKEELVFVESVKSVLDNPDIGVAVKILNAVLIGLVTDCIIEDDEIFFMVDINEKYKDILLETQKIDFVPISKSLIK